MMDNNDTYYKLINIDNLSIREKLVPIDFA